MKKESALSHSAVLLMAYGSPTRLDDVEAYYTDIRRGRPPTPELLEALKSRYIAIGGKTNLLDITLQQAKGLEHRLGIRTYVGMKHWHPYIHETISEIAKSNVREIVALGLAPHYSAMSIGDYGTRVKKAIAEVDPRIHVTFIKGWGEDPQFIKSVRQRVEAMRNEFSAPTWDVTEVVFTAHSLPIDILTADDPYVDELKETAHLVADQLHLPHWRLAFQSAGRTTHTWIGPNILELLPTIKDTGRRQVLVAPVGFTADHLEILYDLDIEAAALAKQLDLEFKRIPSANATPAFIEALAHVIEPFVSTSSSWVPHTPAAGSSES